MENNKCNFGKFIEEMSSNPDVLKQRDFLVEKALEWFEISEDDIKLIEKKDIVKNLYKYMALIFYMAFKDSPEMSKTDKINIKTIERELPEDVYFLKRNVEIWNYLLTYYSGMVDAFATVLQMKDNQTFKNMMNLNFGTEFNGEDRQ